MPLGGRTPDFLSDDSFTLQRSSYPGDLGLCEATQAAGFLTHWAVCRQTTLAHEGLLPTSRLKYTPSTSVAITTTLAFNAPQVAFTTIGQEDKMPDEINLFVSNGTCYSGPYREADKQMLPCGNDANDHVACCQAGDNCLKSNVCFNIAFGVTYVAGCSDVTYQHPTCPYKFEDIGECIADIHDKRRLPFAPLTMVHPLFRNALAWNGLLQWHKQRVGALRPEEETGDSHQA